jgi:hypothetical protein
MHLESDNAIFRRRDLANMNTATHRHGLPTRPRLGGHPPVHVERCGNRFGRRAEQYDGAIALTLQSRNLPPVRCGRRRHELCDPSQRGDTSLTVADQKPCRALDIGQQQCDLARPTHMPHARQLDRCGARLPTAAVAKDQVTRYGRTAAVHL